MIDPEIRDYYERGEERERLTAGGEGLELVRSRELLRRFLPSAPADVLDVGGGAGVYAAWLADEGYRVHLIDPMPRHVEQARTASAAQPDHPFTAAVGDARRLDAADGAYDTILLLGPLYHLTERAERLLALREAWRVLRPGGVVVAVGISRFASLLDGLARGALGDPPIAGMVARDLREGQHRNPTPGRATGWFTTAFFHHPDELAAEVTEAGFALEALLGVEGPGGYVGDWGKPRHREAILRAARAVEREPSLLGMSAHLLAVGRKVV